MVPPEGFGERRAADWMASTIHEAGEDDPGLATGQAVVKALACLVDGQAAAQANPEARGRTGGRNHHGKGDRTSV